MQINSYFAPRQRDRRHRPGDMARQEQKDKRLLTRLLELKTMLESPFGSKAEKYIRVQKLLEEMIGHLKTLKARQNTSPSPRA